MTVAISDPPRRPPRRGSVVVPALAGGAVAALSLPPWGFWPLGPLGVALWLWRLRGLRTRGRALAGLAFGLGLYGLTIFWVTEFHAVGWIGLVTLQALFFSAAAAASPPGTSVGSATSLAAALVVTESLHDVWPVGGIPIGGLGLGQAGGPLASIARIGGPLLVVAGVVVLAAGLLAVITSDRTSDRRATGLLALAVVGCLAIAGHLAPDGSNTGDRLAVALVQGGGPRGFLAVETDPGDVFIRHVDASRRLRPPLDLVLWPENAIDVHAIAGTEEDRVLSGIARRTGATAVGGVTEDVGADRFHNVAVAWSPAGEIVDRYVKVKRVPFGEYAPYRWLFGNLADLSVLPRDAVAGRGPGMLDTPAGRLGVAVSYEVYFTERARAAARAGGQVLLVPTNAASFSTSQVPAEEVAAARFRAIETGRWVLQAAPTGYTAVIDNRGRVHERSVLGRRQILNATVPLRTGSTPYARWGSGPLVVVAAAALVRGWATRRRRTPADRT